MILDTLAAYPYDPQDHYWQVEGQPGFWSTAASGWVEVLPEGWHADMDAALAAVGGRDPETNLPLGPVRVASPVATEALLIEELAARGLDTHQSAVARLHKMLDAATRPILDTYPEAERLSWAAKEVEAQFLHDGAPLLTAEIAAQEGIPIEDVTDEQRLAKAKVVLAKASTWRALIAKVSGLRQRYEPLLAKSKDPQSLLDQLAKELEE
jgi:hypothetical protein